MDFLQFNKQKIVERQDLNNLLSIWRFKNYKLVFTNGCFDILHLGHVDYLSKARSLGDVLIIGLNTDESVRRIKGSTRPINDEASRAMILASLNVVDAVVPFSEDTPYELIRQVIPDILVKGSDYKPHEIVGADIVTDAGGRIETIDFLQGYSTSTIIQKIKS
jgi:rfaE bifunctional protein nucleotidyltransferase chain/domain